MPLDPKEGLHEFRDFRGLRNTVDASDFDPGDLAVALNVDIDDAAGVSRRKGYSAPVTAAIDRALFAVGDVCLGVGGNALKRLYADFSVEVLRPGLTPGLPLSYAAFGARVYYANGAECGVVDKGHHRSWGLPVPSRPVLSLTNGNLGAGRYQVAIAFSRRDGQESGVGVAAVIQVPARGGISVTDIPVLSDPDAAFKAVFISSRDGETLYRVGLLNNDATSFTLVDEAPGVSSVLTQHLQPPPFGQTIGYANGHMLVARGNVLYPSEPYSPELFDLRKGIPLPDRVTMIAAADGADGVWVGTASQVLWLAGAGPAEWRFMQKAAYGVIPGTVAYADGELLADGAAAGVQAIYFATAQGLCVGRAGGVFSNLTSERFNYPAPLVGAGLLRRHRGTAQYLAALQGSAETPNVFV